MVQLGDDDDDSLRKNEKKVHTIKEYCSLIVFYLFVCFLVCSINPLLVNPFTDLPLYWSTPLLVYSRAYSRLLTPTRAYSRQLAPTRANSRILALSRAYSRILAPTRAFSRRLAPARAYFPIRLLVYSPTRLLVYSHSYQGNIIHMKGIECLLRESHPYQGDRIHMKGIALI